MTEVERGGYSITKRPLENGWYELSTMVYSMGEEYRESKRYDHEPTEEDLKGFVQYIEGGR